MKIYPFRFAVAALLLAGAESVAAQTVVTEYRPGVTAEGVTYFLPKTGLHIVVKATKKTFIPGECCQYAERYLRLADVPQQQYDEWTLQGISVEPYAEADVRRAYSIKLKPKTTAPFATLAADGRLLAINCDDVVEEDCVLTGPSSRVTKPSDEDARHFKSEAILAAGSKSKMAEIAASEIYDIRESRSLLSKGQADFMPQDGEQLRLMLANLDKQEAGLLRLFTGTTIEEEHVQAFDYMPEQAGDKIVLCRFSKYIGLVDADNLAGEPVYISLKPQLTPQAEPEESTDESVTSKKASAKETPFFDVRYAVPAKTAVNITYQGGALAQFTLPMPQFGRVETLGAELFNKKIPTHVLFSPETGGILKITTDEK